MGRVGKLIAWGRLLRLSLAPSAAADVAAGLAVAHGSAAIAPRLWWLVPSSLAIYHGSMALNDWADRREDAGARPDRPIPSGEVSPGAARNAAFALLVLGVGFAWLALSQAAGWMAGVAVLASAYNLIGRGPWLGPTLLGLCRAGNLGVGWFVMQATMDDAVSSYPVFTPEHWAHPNGAGSFAARAIAAYGLYVFFVSRLGRLEDVPDERPLGRSPSLYLALAAATLGATPIVLQWRLLPDAPYRWIPVVLALFGAIGLLRVALTTSAWTRSSVLRAMGMSLRRLLVFTAAIALLALPSPNAIPIALAILAGYPASFALRRVFPPS